MTLLVQLAASFIATAAFGIIFNSPRRLLLQSGIVGMIGWMVYYISTTLKMEVIPATCIAAFAVSIVSQLFAKLYRTPIIVFSVAGVIPLVPGGLAYDAMKHVVLDQYNDAVQLAMQAFMISGAIAFGLVFAEVVNQWIRRSAKGKEAARHGGI
ncbi:threonine/serine exporter family protein [Paenibacillus sp. HB172176]|uniref:threonine/serine exporter family protein n=1 Tax=Paenibacillus sp. HB172176 TaxID=2493690 RepID=UPI00143964C6|nr:threonine/serine exporter family protein [Paenibacillus sp. HB172176]